MIHVKDEYRKLLYCAVMLIIFIIFVDVVKNYFKPFFIIIVLLIICSPVNNLLFRKNIINRKLSAILSIIIINLLITIFVFFITKFILNKVNVLINHETYNIQYFIQKICIILDVPLDKINIKIYSLYNSLLNRNFLKTGAAYTTEGLLIYFIGNMAAYFILADIDFFRNSISKFVPEGFLNSIKISITAVKDMIVIEFLLISVTTVITILGFSILNIESPLLLGLICGILDILPYVGTILIFVPIIIFKISSEKYITATGLVLLYLLIIISRQLLEAKFISHKLRIHPLAILISLYIGLKIFGIIGLFIGPIYILAAKEILT